MWTSLDYICQCEIACYDADALQCCVLAHLHSDQRCASFQLMKLLVKMAHLGLSGGGRS